MFNETKKQNEICENCGHEKRYHSVLMKGCLFPVKTEDCDISEEAKDEYLKLGITEIADCSCKKFKVKTSLDKKSKENHECSFSFEKKYVGRKGIYEPKKGETGFSIIRDDWICRCGKTRREYLAEKNHSPSDEEFSKRKFLFPTSEGTLNLSKFREWLGMMYYYPEYRVKEFIRRCKEEVCDEWCGTEDGIKPECKFCNALHKLAGEDLSK